MKKYLLLLVCLAGLSATAQNSTKLTGTPVGATGYNYNTGHVEDVSANAFDGNLNTYYASNLRKFGWVGLQLDRKYIITRVGYAPVTNTASRMKLGVFEGANNPDFSDAVPIYIVPGNTNPATGRITYADVNCSRAFRYVRFCHTNPYAGNNGYPNQADTVRCNVAELEFYGYAADGNDEHLYQLTNLPTLIIHTTGSKDVVTKDEWLTGTFAVISTNDAGKTTIYTDSVKVKGRGNASWGFAKKPYKFKLYNKTNLLGMKAKAKTWTLINNAGDKTLFRNFLADDIARCLKMEYVPDGRFVDVILNGEFKGSYQLTDQIEQNKNRVNVEEMSPAMTDGVNLTGGYIIEIDAYAETYTWGDGSDREELAKLKDKSWFYSNRHTPVTIKYPKDDEIVPAQSQYIRNHYDYFESLMFANDYLTATPNYKSVFDTKSFLKHFIVGELSANPDTYWSVYMYKHRGNDTIYTGPVWDFDLAFDNDGRYTQYSYGNNQDYMYKHGSCVDNYRDLVNRILADPECQARLSYFWSKARKRCITTDNLNEIIDDYADELNDSQTLNFQRWPWLNNYVHQNPRTYGSYQGEVNHVKDYLVQRIALLDNKIGLVDVPDDDDDDVSAYDAVAPVVYSHPGTILMAYFASGSTYRIFNPMGQLVAQGTITDDHQPVSGLAGGLYIVKVQQGTQDITRKLLVP